MYDKYKPVVCKAIGMYVKCQATIDDISQEVFEKVYKHLKTYDAVKGQFSTWIVTIAQNTAIDYLRKAELSATRFVDVNNYVKDSETTNDTSNFFIAPDLCDKGIDQHELKQNIAKAFSNLSPKYKEIAVMYFKQNLQYTDIANVLEVPLNTVKVTIFRIREVLQSALKHEYSLL